MDNTESLIFTETPVVYGGFWERFAASLIDGIILLIPQYIIQALLGAQNLYTDIRLHLEISAVDWLNYFISILMAWLYSALMESSAAQATLGKQALRLKVTDTSGNRVSFAVATGRHFGKIISAIIILIGYFMMLWDEKRQTLHDKMAGTLVVKKPY